MSLKTNVTYYPAMPSAFKEKLLSDEFIVTSEISPPKGVDVSSVFEEAGLVRDYVDAFNVTDNQRAVMRMSPLAMGHLLKERGLDVIMQFTCRDRNRLALQSDLLGAYAMGMENVCIMSGDYPTKGDNPGAKPVYDLDSVQLLGAMNQLEGGYDIAGNPLESAPSFTKGAVCNTEPDQPLQLMKLEKKAHMGIDFFQTQAVYDIGHFETFMEGISHMEVPVLAGLIPLKSAHMARFMNEKIPGIRVGDELIARMESSTDPAEEGLLICAEQIRELKKVCRGIHLMPIGHYRHITALFEMAGLHEKH
ncbi:5,10-methylenetetrahydrofolate reductase [Methanohalophilus euhalobius]|uniref:5,10-methylenetetrahydrofolate reductase n=1 Tax=Methanohalophilus euhalobius TaxID=51203 RepID=A0A285F9D7_9EURY|nr:MULTISPECIES: methylenetetrahydrofolate reductase [Methanohalophilus]ODV50116.1 MAG: methylenetetrahydrofolate reductase [Methanohalophilus sp. 2-GBenrich]RSD35453.1 MAG: methylenetetrahydrofolate reductase [Methanohalophilus sp.]TCL12197.1 5,10-methylenetetrahydrofolate reductase [Methanohalophilus euhalobius]SNY07643.1 5,10-methylenetetrahydrofolate reductase [Methanohalophilus euhalobius]